MLCLYQDYCIKPSKAASLGILQSPLGERPTEPTLDGEKIGYIAKAARLPFVTCLRLKRKVYGVITDIITESFPTKYEFETWFDQSK